jgi:hypothetical protein
VEFFIEHLFYEFIQDIDYVINFQENYVFVNLPLVICLHSWIKETAKVVWTERVTMDSSKLESLPYFNGHMVRVERVAELSKLSLVIDLGCGVIIFQLIELVISSLSCVGLVVEFARNI